MMSEKQKQNISMLCFECGNNFFAKQGTIDRYPKDYYWRCPDCINKARSLNRKNYHKTLSSEERTKRIDRLNQFQRQWYQKLSDEEKIEHRKKISIGYHKMDKVIKEKISETIRESNKKRWKKLSDDERKKIISPMRKANYLYWDSLSDGERAEINKRISISQLKYWDSLTLQDYQLWNERRAIGYNNYLNNLNIVPNKNEETFIDLITKRGINYRYQYYNTMKHSDFDYLFPSNPITGGRFISPYHQWDFIIEGIDEKILIDIDGSIHDPKLTDYEVTDWNGVKFKLKDLIEFNDSQRIYQTDDLDAYIILCYDDNLNKDTIVFSLQNGEIMSLESLLAILSFSQLTNKEKEKIMKGH